MIFTTYWFIVFAAVVLPLYWLVRWPAARLAVLIVACAIFHGHFAGAAGVLPIAVLGVATYFAGRSGRSGWCLGVMVACVAALGFYKYSEFLARSALGWFDPHWADRTAAFLKELLPAAPPLAISFFTFEFVHYLYDVRKGRMRIHSPVDFTLFTIFFPSLVAGPIKRCGDFLPALHRGVSSVGLDDVAVGLARVGLGYFKKTVISDNLAQFIAHHVPRFSEAPMGTRWFIFSAIAFRILLDFSGYSDIAIGMARMLGITLPENFKWPYLTRSIQEFWQCWHISLSTWIRDYLYIPLGGSRLGAGRKVVNGFIVFALCGLWHGAAWNFILWGVYQGAGLAICGTYRTALGRAGAGLGAAFDRFPPLPWLITTFYVWAGWLLFFYPPVQAWRIFNGLFIK